MTLTRHDCSALDAEDALAPMRDAFDLPPGITYLDGNSLGALPRATQARLDEVVAREWGVGLIRSWNSAGWVDLAERVGSRIAALLGVGANEVSVGDSTSVNLYKVLKTAVRLNATTTRRRIVSERSNFPTDLYIAQSVAEEHGLELHLVDDGALLAGFDERVVCALLTHVNYRSGRLHDMASITRAAHDAGALALWDLAHSAGAVPLALTAADADFAVGCGYKFLNGGPGAPAYLWAHPRHTDRMDREQLRQPLAGWFGHAAPFDFSVGYRPAAGVKRYACGTPAVLSMAALECGVGVFAEADAFGGMAALREKSLRLTALFIELVDARCNGSGLALATPREGAMRGSQVSLAHAHGHAVMQALIARGVIGDFRAGDPGAPAGSAAAADLLRFGFTPLYTRFVDAWEAAEQLRDVLATDAWRDTRYGQRASVT